MKIDNTLLTNLEKLSSLSVENSKRDEIISQLSDILEYVDNLSELNTEGIDSYFSALDDSTFLREDSALCDETISKLILSNAPIVDNSFFVVPAIIE